MVTALVTLLAASTPDAVQRTRLAWEAAPDCPEREAFVAALSFRTARAEVVGDGDETKALIAIRIERVGRRFRGTLVLDLPTGVTRREASSPRCSSVVEALSLMSALVIDPEHAKMGPLPSQLPVPARTPPPPTPVEPPVERSVDLEPPAPAPPVEAPAITVATAPAPSPAPSPASLHLGAALHLTTAISGLADIGGTAHLSYQRARFLARLELGGGSGRVVSAAQGDGLYPFHLLAGVSAGVFFVPGPVQVDLLATVQGLLFTVRAPRTTQPLEVVRLSPAVGPSVGLLLRLGRWTVGLRAFVGFNLRLDTYVIDPEGGVFTNPLVFLQPSLVGALAL
ncbi:MAG: hypothetical protein JNJ54_15480 [Myxococcaceae bacterium]|nr:hypothetical protein [Myxococcaceae bacterium]